MRCILLGLLAATACQFDTGTPGGALPGTPDAAEVNPGDPDASETQPDAGEVPQPDAAVMFDCSDWERTPSILDPCADIDVITESLTLNEVGEYLYDSDTGTLTSPGGMAIPNTNSILGSGGEAPRIIVAGAIAIGADSTLRTTGDRPLIMLSWFGATVSGSIDVGSDAELGGGANSSECAPADPGEDDIDGGGGGGGGGFGGNGGAGAEARNGSDAAGGAGAVALDQPTFHGGCPGANGGDGQADSGGNGGGGGGAVHLLVRETLTITGVISSGGAGGGGSVGDRSGGAGGGSGGMIELEAATIQLLAGAVIAANGGGGGGGSNQAPVLAGQPGQPGDVAATGGDGEGAAPAADGGAGGVVGALDGLPGVTSGRGGGGGGGGVGVIRFAANTMSSVGATVSPPADP